MQALSKALLDLRADMVSQAQSDVLANAEQAAAEINVQRLVDKRTKESQVWYIQIIFILLKYECLPLSYWQQCELLLVSMVDGCLKLGILVYQLLRDASALHHSWLCFMCYDADHFISWLQTL